MKRILVSAPGKLNLLGEHVVVHNKPAINMAVNKRCFVSIIPREDQKITITLKNFKTEIITSLEDIINKFEKAQKDWETYSENNNTELLKSITKDPLDYPLIIVGQFLNYFKLKELQGLEIIIDSEVPLGAGMGSSSSLAVCLIGALFIFTNKQLDKELINKIAFLCEQKKHGRPSGGDNTISCYGGLVWFKKDEGMKVLNIIIPEKIIKNFYIINTGKPAESTGEMVSKVADLLKREPRSTNEIFDNQEILVHKLLPALENANEVKIMEIIKKGEANLEKLGVVSKYSQNIIRKIEQSGGAAKICGGGGVEKGTGIILIYHKNLKILTKVLESYHLNLNQLVLGVEGLREEIINE